MTKLLKITASVLMIAAFAAVAVSCSKDDDPSDPNQPVPDPEGTITANISSDTRIILMDIGYIGWTGPDNFNLYSSYGNKVSICDLGEMKGLVNITSIPSTGYTIAASSNASVACESGHGYVVKFEVAYFDGYKLINTVDIDVRLYVVEPIVRDGDIIGAKVKYY
ncbi:MAG: hypothetical protein LBF39_00840 [Prevotellaceae bacterium]|jgi:hypothetical protein|nr:hypothetical protein [Prevotellaceae bacterium]